MNLDFIQGIVAYPSTGSIQQFLTYTAPSVSFVATTGHTDITFAQGSVNYLVSESVDVPNAWSTVPDATDVWLYWDIDTRTAIRTFGTTLLQPLFGASKPPSPTDGQHWFDTINKLMLVFTQGVWKNVIRVFAAKVNTGVFAPLGSGFSQKLFAGTQVGISGTQVSAGRILIDDVGMPVVNSTGTFFTTESNIFVNGSPVNVIRLEANILIATALEFIARFQPVKYTAFGEVNLATYNDIQSTVIGIAMEDIAQTFNGTICLQGHVTNPAWAWTVVGSPVWIDGQGQLTQIDPHITSPSLFPDAKPPVARVVDATSIVFNQGMGGKGDKGDPGSSTTQVSTPSVLGIAKISVSAVNPAAPIVVGDNDLRNTNARPPLSHTHPATNVLITPVGILTGTNVQDNLAIINNSFVKKAGGQMLGPLTLQADPVTPLQASTKNYVDSVTISKLSDVSLLTPIVGDLLSYNGTRWVNIQNHSANLSTSNTFTAPQIIAPVNVATQNGDTLVLDLTKSNNINIAKHGTLTIMLPPNSSIPNGIHFRLVIKNVQNLWCNLILDPRFKFAGGIVPVWDLNINVSNIIECYDFTDDGDVLCSAIIGVK